MGDQHLADLIADPIRRVQAGHRFLKHHGDLPPAHAAHVRFRKRQQIAPLQQDLAGHDRSRVRHQAQDAARGHRLAAARLADH